MCLHCIMYLLCFISTFFFYFISLRSCFSNIPPLSWALESGLLRLNPPEHFPYLLLSFSFLQIYSQRLIYSIYLYKFWCSSWFVWIYTYLWWRKKNSKSKELGSQFQTGFPSQGYGPIIRSIIRSNICRDGLYWLTKNLCVIRLIGKCRHK